MSAVPCPTLGDNCSPSSSSSTVLLATTFASGGSDGTFLSPRASSSSGSSSGNWSPSSAAAPSVVQQQQQQQSSTSSSRYSNCLDYSMTPPLLDDSTPVSLRQEKNNEKYDADEAGGGGRWMAMARTAAQNGAGSNVLSMLQRAFCSNFVPTAASAKYRTVLTRASMDSGLELDDMELNKRGEKRKRGDKRRDQKQEKMVEEGESGREREKCLLEQGQNTQKGARGTTADGEGAETEGAEENKKQQQRRSLGRLLSVFLFPSADGALSSNPSPSFHHQQQQMFDFPTSPGGTAAFALSSPVAQLSHSNAVLVQENERLSDRVGELELMLRDHVAHINSIYHTLHMSHGFHALQLPDGEFVHLSKFHGFPLRFVCHKTLEKEIIADNDGQKLQHQPNNVDENRHLVVGQARRFLLQQRQRRRQQQPAGSANESLSQSSVSGCSSSSFASSSSTFDSAFAAADPVDLSYTMMRRLCIRPVARDDSDEMQAFMEWLKNGGTAGDECFSNGGGSVLSPPPTERHSISTENGAVGTEETIGGGNPRSPESVGTIGNGTIETVAHRSQRQPPTYSVMSKSQRLRTQYPSLSSRHRSPALSAALIASSSLNVPSSASSSAGITHKHHGGFGGSATASLNVDETAPARSPRRAGIGITNMGRTGGGRSSDAQKTAKRHLI